MRDNEFDKGVQEKMGEFRLQPSAPVWVEVERRIHERKRRRILIFWFCLSGLLIAGLGGWWTLQSDDQSVAHKDLDEKQPSVTKSGDEIIEKKSVVSAPVKNNTGTNKLQSAATEEQSNVNTEQTLNSSSETENKKGQSLKKDHLVRIKANAAIPGKQKTTAFTTGNGKKAASPKKKGEKVTREDLSKKNVEPSNTADVSPSTDIVPPVLVSSPVTTPAVSSAIAVQSVAAVAIPADSFQAAKMEQEQVVKPAVKPIVKKGKWQTGLVFAFGETKLTRGDLNVFMNKRLNFDQLQSGSVSGNYGNGTLNNQSFADSIPLKGPAFHAGIFAKRKTGKKTAFSAGLNFSFYSGKQRVGTLVDSVRLISSPFSTNTSDGFYRSGSSARFTNRYYYIQVPLLLHWQINKGAKGMPLEWENGIVPSYMISNRALVYDPAGRIFFRDKTVYTKLSLVYQTGFTATFASRTKHPLTAGFYYNYHFSQLQNINPPDFNNLSSYGVQFRWLLKK